jgi:hypothetical protein
MLLKGWLFVRREASKYLGSRLHCRHALIVAPIAVVEAVLKKKAKSHIGRIARK